MTDRAAPAPREQFSVFYPLHSRWADNDIYGHINNVAYYAFFDSVVNRFLIEEGGMRPGVDTVVGYVVSSSADYFRPSPILRGWSWACGSVVLEINPSLGK